MSAPLQEMTEYRVGRNFVRVGDRVKVTTPGKWPIEVIVKAIRGDGTDPAEIDVIVARTNLKGRSQAQAGMTRCFTADRIVRIAQTKGGQRRLSA